MSDTYIRASMVINTNNPDEIQRIIDHHIDYLIDMDDNPDIISISDAISYDIKSDTTSNTTDKLIILLSVINDILDYDIPFNKIDPEILNQVKDKIDKIKEEIDENGKSE